MNQFEQLLTCAICLDRYRNPKLLPCQHSFCMEPCMDGLVDYVRRQVKCPECRAEHRIPYQGVQAFPTNVTLKRFLDLHIEITGELPDPTSGQIMERCTVCSEKAYLTPCQHCDKKICPECKGAHMDILRREIVRINNQIRRGLHKLQDSLQIVEKNTSNLQSNCASVNEEIDEINRRLSKALKDRTDYLRNEIDRYIGGELRTLRTLKDNLELEIANIQSNCDLADKHMTERVDWDDSELMDAKEIFLKTVEFIRNFEMESNDYIRRIRFIMTHDPNQLVLHVAGYGELNINQVQPQGLTPPTNPGLMRSKSDHRLAFRQEEEEPRKFGFRRPTDDYEYEEQRPRSRYRSRLNPETEPEPKVRFEKERERVLDTEDVARGPLSGISRLLDSPRVMQRISEVKKKEVVQAPVPVRKPVVYTPPPPAPVRQVSEDDEITRIKRLNKGAGSSTDPVERPQVERVQALKSQESDDSQQSDDSNSSKRGSKARSASTESTSSESSSTPRPLEPKKPETRPEPQPESESSSEEETESEDEQKTDIGPLLARSAQARESSAESSRKNSRDETKVEEQPKYQSRFLNRTEESDESRYPSGRSRYMAMKDRRSRLARSKSSHNFTEDEDEAATTTNPNTYLASRGYAPTDLSRSRSTHTLKSRETSPERAPPEKDGAALSSWARYLKNKYGNKKEEASPRRLSLGIRPESSDDDSKNMQGSPTTPTAGIAAAQAVGTSPRSQYLQKRKQLFKIGMRGSEPGCFTWPRGIAVGPDNTIVVADSSNHRVQVFDSVGKFITEFGSYGNGEGEFDCLAGVAINRIGQYIIADRYNHRIQVFDPSGRFLRSFGSQGTSDGRFNYPWGITTDALGFIYVCDKENHRVQVFQSDGTFVGKFGSMGNKTGQLEHPHYIAVSNTNRVIVSDSNNHRVQVFDVNGRVIFAFGAEGSEEGQFKFPKGVAVDDQGYIFVADSGNNRIQIFGSDGSFLRAFGCWGAGEAEFKGLEGVAVMSNGNILVCDRENHRVQAF